jgi:hypothetical protein
VLSKRLKELIDAGVVTTIRTSQPGIVEYKVTEAGEELRGIVASLGVWGQRWIESSLSLKNLDPSLLMWDMRRSVATASFPDRKCTVKLSRAGPGSKLLVDRGRGWRGRSLFRRSRI